MKTGTSTIIVILECRSALDSSDDSDKVAVIYRNCEIT